MAHHQGMTIVGVGNALLGGATQGYFHAEAAARATELLLQEKPPRSVEAAAPEALEAEAREARFPVWAGRRRLHRGHYAHTQLLSGSRYVVMINAAGAGFSRCAGLAVTRWSGCDGDTSDTPYLRRDSGEVWSCGFQPTAVKPDSTLHLR